MARFAMGCVVILGMLVAVGSAHSAAYPRKILLSAAQHSETERRAADPPVSGGPQPSSDEKREAEAPENAETPEHHHSDKSVAGGGVIIGGLVTAIFAAVYCYIRVTRKRVEGDQRSVY